MTVRPDRERIVSSGTTSSRLKWIRTFIAVPAIISAAWIVAPLIVNLLDHALTDISNVHIAGYPIERKTKRIAEPKCPNLRSKTLSLSVGIGCWDCIGQRV